MESTSKEPGNSLVFNTPSIDCWDETATDVSITATVCSVTTLYVKLPYSCYLQDEGYLSSTFNLARYASKQMNQAFITFVIEDK